MKSLMQPVLALILGQLVSGSAVAQTNWAQMAVPAYSPAHVLQGLHQHWTRPPSDDFARQAQALPEAVKTLCDATPPARQAQLAARGHWQAPTHAWERLSSVADTAAETKHAVADIINVMLEELVHALSSARAIYEQSPIPGRWTRG